MIIIQLIYTPRMKHLASRAIEAFEWWSLPLEEELQLLHLNDDVMPIMTFIISLHIQHLHSASIVLYLSYLVLERDNWDPL